MTQRSVTAQYPDVEPELPPRSRGVIALFEENCTVCMLCARECPDWCIYIDSHKETIPAPTAGGRERSRNVLDRFAIDFSLCMYCGICIEVCPFDALFWSPEFEYAEYDIRDLTHEKDRLGEWMWTVPPPPALDHARRAGQGGRRRRRRPPERAPPRAAEPPAPSGTPSDRRRDRGRGRCSCCSALVAVGSALLVVTTRHLVHAALWLVVTLGALAGLLPVLAAEFVAWVQVLIYVGAVVVLLLFALMLTRAPIGRAATTSTGRPAGAGRAGRGRPSGVLLVGDRRRRLPRRADRPRHGPSSAPPRRLGASAVPTWVLPFEVLSVLLLAALVGAIVLSRRTSAREPDRGGRRGADAAAHRRCSLAALLFGIGVYGVLRPAQRGPGADGASS